MSQKVLVVGAGIGGLVAARALALCGHRVTLVERAPRFDPIGAGIILSANSIAVLDALGVDARHAGNRLSRMDGTDEGGRTISTVDLNSLRKDLGEVVAFHRGDLHDALAAALPASVDLRMGVELEGLQIDADGADARFGDGTSGRWDLVIGADGIHSKVRGLVGRDVALRYSGETCWRAVVRGPAGATAEEAWGRGGARFGTVPLTGGRAYVFLVLPYPPGAPTPPWSELAARFGGFGGLAGVVWPGVTAEALLHHDLYELSRIEWGTPRAWLLGDAAHAMTPNLGQGAGMAIEDAAALAPLVGPDVDAGFGRYVNARHARVAAIKKGSRRMGAIGRIANPLLRWARNAAFRLAPASAGEAALRRVAMPGVRLARDWSSQSSDCADRGPSPITEPAP